MAMLSELIEPPAAEPVALADLKDFLRVATDADDDLITALGVAARATVERATGLALLDQSWRLTLDAAPATPVTLPLAPVTSISAVSVLDAAGGSEALPSAAYEAATGPEGRILFVAPPLPGRRLGGLAIDDVAGHGPSAGDVPEPLRLAVRLLTAHWYEHRGDDLDEGAVLPGAVLACSPRFAG